MIGLALGSKQPSLRPHTIAETLGKAYDNGELHMRDVIVRTTVTPVRGKAALGPSCREVPDTDADFQWYEFVARDGLAAIRRADAARHLSVLVSTHTLSLPLNTKATLEAACVNDAKGQGRLWLSVNGKRVLFVRVLHPLGNGAPGLVAYDAPANAYP